MNRTYDAVVIGSGPNGLAAAITVARAGRSVLVLEARGEPGGGMRTAELTLPGFHHDVCSAVHPLGAGSPFFQRLPLADHGLEWLQPEVALAHPLDGGRAAVLLRSLDETAARLDRDGAAYRRIFGPIAESWRTLAPDVLGPILRVPRHPVALARFGIPALLPAAMLGRVAFRDESARALLTGLAAHGTAALDAPLTAAPGLVLGAAGHAVGWPVARGGAASIAVALLSYLQSLGGEIELERPVHDLATLPPARVIFADVMPPAVAAMAGPRLALAERRRMEAHARGPGIFKLDYALSGPMPWTADACRHAGTVHVSGDGDEVARSEHDVARGYHPERPFVLVAQQSIVDPSRAPAGKHTLWAYCHVPNGSTVDMTSRIEAQLERFAPGFRDLVLARSALAPADLERYNPNYAGGDIGGGSAAGLGLVSRPRFTRHPYRTAIPGVYLCSSATPPGGGVHGMCGYHAARDALRRELR